MGTERTTKEITYDTFPRGPSSTQENEEKKKDHTTLYHHEISSLYREREHSDSKAFGKKGGGVDTKD